CFYKVGQHYLPKGHAVYCVLREPCLRCTESVCSFSHTSFLAVSDVFPFRSYPELILTSRSPTSCFSNVKNNVQQHRILKPSEQLVMEGFKYHFASKSVATVWSAPNYCYRCGNVAAMLALDENLGRDFKIFHEVEESSYKAQQRQAVVPYFL
ncbi:unnamed protein product, partial [Ectocarpus fasciculatus]